jgi:hypothetical protein
MAEKDETYPVKFEIEYPVKLDRVSSFFRLLWGIPIVVILTLLTSSGSATFMHEGESAARSGGGSIAAGIGVATALMILFQQRYPRWWFDFVLELNRFSTRVGAYMLLLTDRYPSTVDHQSVQLDLVYPDVQRDLNRWLPLVKWLLAIPHYVVLVFLIIGVAFATIVAWFSILFTGSYPRGLFDYVVGVARWCTRVSAYAFLLTTDKYPPFSLE